MLFRSYTLPHVLFTSTGTRLVSSQKTTSLGSTQTLTVHRRTSAGVASTINVVTTAVAGQPLHSTLVALPDARILMLAAYDDLASAGLQIRAYLSTDDGATWTLQATACLPTYIDTSTTTVKRIRAAYYGGQVLLVIAVRVPTATVPDTLWQYASIDQGVSFALVEAVAGTSSTSVHTGGYHDVVAIPDEIGRAHV